MSDTNPKTVTAGAVVTIDYKLFDDTGEKIEDTSEGSALAHLQGSGSIVPGLEEALEGKSAGESFEVTLPPEKAYGEQVEGRSGSIPREAFPEDAPLDIGMAFVASTEEGEESVFWVMGFDEKQVLVDGNHPLAGATLRFQVEVREIRDATPEEREHGHAHGEGGHEH